LHKNKFSTATHAARLKRSGLSAAEYCRRFGVNVGSLYTFMCQERKRNGQHALVKPLERNSALTFSQLPYTPATFSTHEIELVFPDGLRAIFPCVLSEADLRKLARVLRGDSSRISAC
jgi:hypothetical protein